MRQIHFSSLWLLLLFPIGAIAAAAFIILNTQDSDSDRVQELAAMPSPPPVTFIPPTPLPTEVPTQQNGLLGNPAPDLIFTTLEDEQIRLQDLQNQVVFLNFWATWCVPCQDEMPTLQVFQAEHENVSVIAITDPTLGQTEDDIRSFVEEYKLTFPIALSSDLALFDQFGVVQLPITFIIDPQGVIRYQHVGELHEHDMEEYLALLTG